MIYRRFGRTGIQMPVFSCGGMRYQHKWQDVPLSEVPDENQRNLEATIRRAVELGINHIETARGYGSSERQLGLILPKLPREKLIIQTKVAPSEDAAEFVKAFDESLERLQVSHVDLLAIHGINNEQTLEWSIRKGGCLEAARQIQHRGLARHIGFSTHGSTELLLKAIEHEGDGGFDYVNLHWYYIFQRNWPAVQAAARRDMGVFIISPSDKGGMLYNPPARLVDLCKPLPPMVFNDLFCLSHPEIHTLSLGASRPTDFDAHLEALPLLGRADELLAPVLANLRERYAAAIPKELREPFSLPVPSWEQIPGEVNITTILWLRNLAVAFDLVDYGKMRYNLLGNGGHWFPGNKAANLDAIDFGRICGDRESAASMKQLLGEADVMLGGEGRARLSQEK